MTDRSQLTESLRALRGDRVSSEDLYHVIHEFGEGGFIEAEPDVAQFLVHDNPQLRYIAINVLTLHWGMVKYRRELERIIVDDGDEDVRRIAVVGLGYVLRESHDSQATRLLIAKLRDISEDIDVRQTAFDALMDIWLPTTRREKYEHDSLLRTLREAKALVENPKLPEELHIDWDIVEAIERGEVP